MGKGHKDPQMEIIRLRDVNRRVTAENTDIKISNDKLLRRIEALEGSNNKLLAELFDRAQRIEAAETLVELILKKSVDKMLYGVHNSSQAD